jgi:hypothetical protein
MEVSAARSSAYASEAKIATATPDDPNSKRLRRYGSIDTRKSITPFRNIVPLVSIGSTDIMFVYRSQIEIRIRKLKPNPARFIITSAGLEGGLLSRATEPIDNASPNMRSVNDSILVFGVRLLIDCVNVSVSPW